MLLRQLLGVWVIGSVLAGTLAVLFTVDRGSRRVQPLTELSVLSSVGVAGVLVALFAALALLAWGTPGTTWLPETGRGRGLWAVLVAVGGLAGWAFAAAVTFAIRLPLDAQLTLGYLAGGLPFTVVATTLLRPAAATFAGLALTGLLLGIGVTVAPNVVRVGVELVTVLTAP